MLMSTVFTLYRNCVMKSLFLIFIPILMIASCAPDVMSPIAKNTELGSTLLGLAQQFSVPVEAIDLPGASLGMSFSPAEPTDSEALLKYTDLFTQEFSKYPEDLIAAAKLKEVAVVKNLVVSGQGRAAMSDIFRKILYLDFIRGAYNPTYQRHVIHHEFYHMFEPALNGNGTWQDPQWAALNSPGFEYGSGGASMQGNSGSGVLNHPLPGFIDLYSTSGLEEDKAEIYASLFIPEEYKKVMEWAAMDPILANKIAYMKNTLREKCPEMDDAFWTRLHSGN
jgi:hypothetical protein